MEPADAEHLETLVRLVRDRTQQNRRILRGNADQLLLSPAERLSELEGSLMADILRKFIQTMERPLRRELADRLASLARPPLDLVEFLANENVALAFPTLLQNGLLRQLDLIDVVKLRAREHILSTARTRARQTLISAPSTATEEDDPLDIMLRADDPVLAARARDYVVEQARRTDRFKQPVLLYHDVRRGLRRPLFWRTAAAMRHGVIETAPQSAILQEARLDGIMEDAARTAFRRLETQDDDVKAATRLAGRLAEVGELHKELLPQALRHGHIQLFASIVAGLCGTEEEAGQRMVLEPNGEALAMVCRALGFQRHSLAVMADLIGNGDQERSNPVLNKALLTLYDKTSKKIAWRALSNWNREPEFQAALQQLSQSDRRSHRE